MARYHGKSGVAYISTTGAGAAANMASVAGWTLDKGTDKAEVTCFGDLNKTYVQGLPDIKGSISFFFDDSESKLYQAADSADGCKLYLYVSSGAVGRYWYGPAWVDYQLGDPVGDAIKGTGQFVANGSWGRL